MYKFYFIFISFVLIANISIANNSSGDNLKKLQKQLKSKDTAQVYTATAELAAYYRQEGELKKAEQVLKKFQSPSGFDRLPPKQAIPYLRCLLEMAHLRALNKDVTGSLSLLNWAEGRKQDYERAISCIKYADILLDLNEPDRAKSYLKNANDLINKHLGGDADQGAAIGQGSKVVDTGASWRLLQDQSDYVAAIVEELQLSKKFGATYGLYVKLRRLQRIVKRSHSPRYFNEAMRLCDEIVDMDPSSQFAQAAGYLKGKILFSAIPDQEGKAQKEAIKKAKQCLEKFIKSDPEGLYRGEAMMMMGKICLEKEWNAKEAEKYYSQALTWFQNSRKKRDALSLYAPITDDLKKQTQATQRPTTLNQWKRTVYHDEDPLKLYNTASAPSWYIDDKEKNCVFALGLLLFANNKYDEARKYWKQIISYSPELASLDPRFPNVQKRLLAACNVGYMMFTSVEKAPIKNSDIRLKLQYAEYLFLLERFDEAIDMFQHIANEQKNITSKAVAVLGIADCEETKGGPLSKKRAAKYYKWVIQQKALKKEHVYGAALYRYGYSLRGIYKGEKLAEPLFSECVKNFPDGRYSRKATYQLICCYLFNNQLIKAQNAFNKFSMTKDIYTHELIKSFKLYKEGKIGGKK